MPASAKNDKAVIVTACDLFIDQANQAWPVGSAEEAVVLDGATVVEYHIADADLGRQLLDDLCRRLLYVVKPLRPR